jgi:hypothetical protein
MEMVLTPCLSSSPIADLGQILTQALPNIDTDAAADAQKRWKGNCES